MRLYIAGSSKELHRAERWIAKCREVGIVITCDWPAMMRAAGPDHALDETRLGEAALADLQGVLTADLMWLLMPPATATSTGCWTELGIALGANIDVFASLPTDEYGEAATPQFNIFSRLRFVPKFDSDAKTFDAIIERARASAAAGPG